MARMVLLEHVLPDGTGHFDWLIEPRGLRPTSYTEPLDPDAKVLISFRVTERIDATNADTFIAIRLPDHRRKYLNFEGEISPGKGFVRRQAHGKVQMVNFTDDLIEIRAQFVMRQPAIWKGRPDGIAWLFNRIVKPAERVEREPRGGSGGEFGDAAAAACPGGPAHHLQCPRRTGRTRRSAGRGHRRVPRAGRRRGAAVGAAGGPCGGHGAEADGAAGEALRRGLADAHSR